MIQILDVVVIVFAGLLVGSELAVAAFVHPTFDRLPDDVHLPGAIAIARILGRVMPFWYGLVAVTMCGDIFVRRYTLGRWPLLITIAAVLWVLSILYSVIALVPINNRIAAWTQGNRPSDWKSDRHRWDVLHRWRVLLLTLSFILLVVGILQRGLIC